MNIQNFLFSMCRGHPETDRQTHNLPGGFFNVHISTIINKDFENFSVSAFRGHGDSCGVHLQKYRGIFHIHTEACVVLLSALILEKKKNGDSLLYISGRDRSFGKFEIGSLTLCVRFASRVDKMPRDNLWPVLFFYPERQKLICSMCITLLISG